MEFKNKDIAEFLKADMGDKWVNPRFTIRKIISDRKDNLLPESNVVTPITGQSVWVRNLEEAKKFWLEYEDHFIFMAILEVNIKIDKVINSRSKSGYRSEHFWPL